MMHCDLPRRSTALALIPRNRQLRRAGLEDGCPPSAGDLPRAASSPDPWPAPQISRLHTTLLHSSHSAPPQPPPPLAVPGDERGQRIRRSPTSRSRARHGGGPRISDAGGEASRRKPPHRRHHHHHNAAGGNPTEPYTIYKPRSGVPPSSRRRSGRRRRREPAARRRARWVNGEELKNRLFLTADTT